MTAIILLVGLSNLVLGYALAVLLGLGPEGGIFFGDAWSLAMADSRPLEELPATHAAEAPAPVPASAARSRSDDLLDSMLGKPGGQRSTPVASAADGPPPDEAGVFVGAAILRMNAAIDSILLRTAETDIKFREQVDKYDLPAIQGVFQELMKECRAYLAEQLSASQQVQERLQATSGWEALAEQIAGVHREHAAGMERFIDKLQNMESSEPAQAAQWLLGETVQLLSAWHTLRDFHQTTFLAAARQARQLGRLVDSQKTDSLTGLNNRIGMEELLEQWLAAGRPAQQSICAAMFDMDRFGALNMEQGSQVGDRVLYHVGQHLLGTLGADAPLGRVAGQRFLLLTAGQGERNTVRVAQGLRQSIAQFAFTHRGRQSRVTASAAVTELTPDDTSETLWKRLEEALAETKRNAGNQLTIHDGTRITPVPAAAESSDSREVLV